MESRRNIAVLGARGVGKTSVIIRFCYNRFDEGYTPTIEATYPVTLRIDNRGYQCDIMDTAGRDEFSTLSGNTAIGVHGYLIAFSVRDRGSFELVEGIKSQLMVTFGGQMVPTVLVGNKCESAATDREVTYEEGKKLAQNLKIGYAECSALTGTGVRELFINLLREVNRSIAEEVVTNENKCCIS